MNNVKLYERVLSLKDFLELQEDSTKHQIDRSIELINEIFKTLERRGK